MRIAFVDGYRIRQTLDTDFNVIHVHEDDPTQYSPKFYIPRGEVWIDSRFKREAKYLLKVELEWLGDNRVPYHELRKRVDERVQKLGKPPKFVKRSAKRDGLTVRYVDGSIVRRFLDPEFVCGGHDLVYGYIPKKEVWIDALMDPRDISPVLLHETTERGLMAKGTPYDAAHEFATATERLARRNHGALYPGEPGYERGLTKTEFSRLYVKSYATIKG